ncbi:MAG: phosphate/phosphite/phosphonate ABC transporter substrate-binding protein [Candidatus Ozemobacteraceae bacterium]
MRPLVIIFLCCCAFYAFFSLIPQTQAGSMQVAWRFSKTPHLCLAILPYRSDEELQREFSPLAAYLSHHLGIPVQINIALNYASLVQLLDLKVAHLAWYSSTLFEQTASNSACEVLCRPIQNGSIRHRGAIIVKADSPLNSIQDLRGKRFAYVDKISGTGFLKPAQFFRQQGIDPVAFFGEIFFTGNHSRSLQSVLNGEADAAAIFVDQSSSYNEASGSLPVGVKALAWTDWSLTDPIVVRRDLPAPMKQKLKELFLLMEKLDKGPETLAEMKKSRGFERFVAE